MVAKVSTVSFQGMKALEVEAQVNFMSGLPSFQIVGLPDKAVGESRERIRNALHSIGIGFPLKKISVNLSPASLQKEGTHYDVPIALGILAEMKVLSQELIEGYVAVGELSLDGVLQPVSGVLPASFHALKWGKKFICPQACGCEAGWIKELEVIAAPNLLSLINYLKGTQVIAPPIAPVAVTENDQRDFSEIKGQLVPKRALEIAAVGGHNVLMVGPPGAGKSMLAERLRTILPPLTPAEALDVSMVYSLSGLLKEGKILRQRPFRAPHHSASMPALVGGGLKTKPGEISLAHRGVLFLDELPEFNGTVLESLRQPLETRSVSVARANAHVSYPADFQLIAAMNPCRCGYLADAERACARVPICGQQYTKKISGPLLDRFDLHISVDAVKPHELSNMEKGESSAVIFQRVLCARQFQKERLQKTLAVCEDTVRLNSQLSSKEVEKTLCASDDAQKLMHEAAERFKLSARSYYRTLRVARTIADMEQKDSVEASHIGEALCYRPHLSF